MEGRMARPVGSKNKIAKSLPPTYYLSSEERIVMLANIIVDRILEDQCLKENGN